MSKSEPKTHCNQRNVCLPFPHPMRTSTGSVIWPFSQKGFPLFYAKINLNEKCIEISDETGVKSLQNMGFFGFYSKFRFDWNYGNKCQVLPKPTTDETIESNTRLKLKINPKKYSDGHYVLTSTSVPNAFSDNQCLAELESVSEMETKEEIPENDSKIGSNLLKLSFLESFFISYIFGSLNVSNVESNDYLTIDGMWDTFGQHYSDDRLEFAVHYSAYHYLRSKGWVVRNGQSFGSHFLLYREGPHLYHALYSALIRYSIDGHFKEPFDWHYISALIRLSRNVRKDLIVCVVNVPKDCDISSPKCIQNFEIELIGFDRWNATKGNANDDRPLS